MILDLKINFGDKLKPLIVSINFHVVNDTICLWEVNFKGNCLLQDPLIITFDFHLNSLIQLTVLMWKTTH